MISAVSRAIAFLVLAALTIPEDAHAQAARAPVARDDAEPAVPRLSLMAGFGPTTGGLGGVVDLYLSETRLALFGSVGLLPDVWGAVDRDTLAVGAGVRAYWSRARKRGFVELGVLVTRGKPRYDSENRLVLQLGYESRAPNGLTFRASGGLAKEFPDEGGEPWVGVGVGYTWTSSSAR